MLSNSLSKPLTGQWSVTVEALVDRQDDLMFQPQKYLVLGAKSVSPKQNFFRAGLPARDHARNSFLPRYANSIVPSRLFGVVSFNISSHFVS